jgi:hypothetical protein
MALRVAREVLHTAEYALLAHSMPGIAGSAQISRSGVLPGDPPALVSGWPAGGQQQSGEPQLLSHQRLRTPNSATWPKPASPVEAIASSGAALCERRLVADSVRRAV